MLLVGRDFNVLFQTFESSAFRLETRDHYAVDGEIEALRAFQAGDAMPAAWAQRPWAHGIIAAGKSLQRVHVLRSPLSDYLRFELGWGYAGNVAAGEDVRIIDLADGDVAGLPDHDFWLFDDVRTYRMHYTDAGEFLGAEALDADAIGRYRGYRDTAVAHSVAYPDYWIRSQPR